MTARQPSSPSASHVAATPLRMSAALQQELIQHARDGDPDEVCGILAGRDGQVLRVFPVVNGADRVAATDGVFRDRSSGQPTSGHKPVHYYMDPRDQLRVYNEIDALDWDVVGYYHSHTHTEARPSPTDVRLANDPFAYYVLISLEDKSAPAVRAWKILKADPAAETGDLLEVPIGES